MEAGELNRRLRVQALTTTVSADGFSVEAWNDFASIWAKIQPVSARDLIEAGQQEVRLSHQVTTRYRTDLNTRMRLRYGTRIFQIQSIRDPDEAHKELDLLCMEVTTGQVAT